MKTFKLNEDAKLFIDKLLDGLPATGFTCGQIAAVNQIRLILSNLEAIKEVKEVKE